MLKEFIIDVYKKPIWIATDIEEAKKFFSKDYKERGCNDHRWCIEGADAMTMDVYDNNHNVGILIYFDIDYINDIGTGSNVVNVIAHESYHAADMLRTFLDLTYNGDADNEHIAYLVGYIAECCWKTIGPYIKGTSKSKKK